MSSFLHIFTLIYPIPYLPPPCLDPDPDPQQCLSGVDPGISSKQYFYFVPSLILYPHAFQLYWRAALEAACAASGTASSAPLAATQNDSCSVRAFARLAIQELVLFLQ